MEQVNAKLANCRGETLVEVLASILIASLSVLLLLSGAVASAHLNRQADLTDDTFYAVLTAAEARSSPVATATAPEVEIDENGTTIRIPVQVYGGEGLYSYALDPTARGDGP